MPGLPGMKSPTNPYLATSPWPISHQISYQQACSDLRGVTRNYTTTVDRDFTGFQAITLTGGDQASDSIAIAEDDGIYVVSQKVPFRVQRPESTLSIDEVAEVWSATAVRPYPHPADWDREGRSFWAPAVRTSSPPSPTAATENVLPIRRSSQR